MKRMMKKASDGAGDLIKRLCDMDESINIEFKRTSGDMVHKALETALGVTPHISPHRKPRHLLYCFTKNKIDETRLNEFCGLVQSCFPDKAKGGQ